MKLRTAVKRGLDQALKPLGSRVISQAEENYSQQRLRRLIDQLIAVYSEHVFPDLDDLPGRRELLHQLIGTEVPEAMFLISYLTGALSGPGDICEFGVAQGATSALMANEIRDSGRTLWLYDSFEGLSAPTDKDVLIDDIFGLGSMQRYTGKLASPEEHVRQRLANICFPSERVQVVAGFIRPDLPPAQLPDQVAFAYLDMDLYQPVRVALDLLHPRCREGSVLMVDDYGFFSSGPKTAVTEFLNMHEGKYALQEAPPSAGNFCALRRVG